MKSTEQQPYLQLYPENIIDLPKNNIAIVGFMGTGKTTVGKILSTKCGLTFVDVDECITNKAAMDIPSIFNRYGESYFRDLEEDILKEIFSHEHQVISCGGGVVTKEVNRQMLKKNAVNCWLYNTLETSLSRIKVASRPLLDGSDPDEKAMNLYRVREALYLEVAHCSICTENLSQIEIADIICENIYRPIFCRS